MDISSEVDNIIENQDINNSFINYSIDSVHNCFNKYRNNPYMLSKIHHVVCNQLPNMLLNIEKEYLERQHRLEELTSEHDCFIQSFLTNNRYFYNHTTEKFFYYDSVHYQLYNEDDILHQVLSSISRDRTLMSWKKRTKINIMKRIKDDDILKSVPESITIQNVLDFLYPTLFHSKTEAKYFLTILGDNIHRKNSNLVHFIHPCSKGFIRELNQICMFVFGINLSNTFKNKYHEHEYTNCRLVRINECVKIEGIWLPTFTNNALDILCVASHYSIRYNCSDDYLKNSNDLLIKQNVFYLKDHKKEDIIELFLNEYVQIPSSTNDNGTGTHITWKNMQYLWKHFLESQKLPSIMFQNTLKNHVVTILQPFYKEDLDSFQGVFSKYLPAIQRFIEFWKENIVFDENESDFEIEELSFLFKKWSNTPIDILTEKEILNIISYYYSMVEIEQDKYIHKICCNLWDKQIEIQIALDSLKKSIREKIENNSDINTPPVLLNQYNISFYDAYVYYCKYYSNETTTPQHPIASKSYFEKYILENYNLYVLDNCYIKYHWSYNN